MHSWRVIEASNLLCILLLCFFLLFLCVKCQCFADTAHNPVSNARPSVVATAVPAVVHPEHAVGGIKVGQPDAKTNIMSHLPRPKPYQSFQVKEF